MSIVISFFGFPFPVHVWLVCAILQMHHAPHHQKPKVIKRPSQLMQCTPLGMSRGRYMYWCIYTATLLYSIQITVF